MYIQIVEENKLGPEDIEKVEVSPHPVALNRMWLGNELKTEEDISFKASYLIACAAYRINRLDFLNPSLRRDPRIINFMKKVKVLPSIHVDFGPSMIEDPITRVLGIEISAKGKIFKKIKKYGNWLWRPEEVRATDEDLVEKFNENVSGFLSAEKIKKSTGILLKLEGLKNVNNLMELIAP